MAEKSLEEMLALLREQQERARLLGFRGEGLAQRAEEDLKRIMSSAWLNLYEFCDDRERQDQASE